MRAYRAIDNRELCDQYSEGHVQILRDFGITNVTTNNDEWKLDPDVYFLMCFDDLDSEPVAGVRIQKFNGVDYPPVCEAVGDMDSNVYGELDMAFELGTAEICGLWAGKRVLGRGLGTILTRAGVAFATQVNVKCLFCITAQFNIDMVRAIGFREILTLGNQGLFPYPNEMYQASVLKIPDIDSLEDADPIVKMRLLSLRAMNEQIFTETVHKKEITISYNLLLTTDV